MHDVYQPVQQAVKGVGSTAINTIAAPTNIVRVAAADISHNQLARQNALNALAQSQHAIGGLAQWPGSAIGSIGATLLNRPNFTPTNSLERLLAGNHPTASIQGAYNQARQGGESIPTALTRSGLQLASDLPIALKGAKVAGSAARVTVPKVVAFDKAQNQAGFVRLPKDEAAFRKNAQNAYKVTSGQKASAPIQPKGNVPPVTYTRNVHNYLLSKKNAKDVASRQYIDSLGHIKTLSNPTAIIPKTPRDVRYLEQGVKQGALGKVSLKPQAAKGQSYINTAYIIKNPGRIAKELNAKPGVPAPGIAAPAKNSTFSGNGADVTSNVAQIRGRVNPLPRPGVPLKNPPTPVEVSIKSVGQGTKSTPVSAPVIPKVIEGLAPKNPYTGAPKSPGAFARAWQSVNGVIAQHGTGGAEIARRNIEARNQSEIGQQAFLDKIPTVTKLSKNDFTTFVQTLDKADKGEPVSVAPHIQQAVSEWNKAIPEIRQRAVNAGLSVGDLGKNYFPRQYKDLFKNDKTMGKMAQQLVSSGKAKDLGEAIGQLQFMKNEYQRPFGNLESTRHLDLQGYEQTHQALANYIGRSFDRISKAEQFGGKNETLHQLLARAQQEGYNATPDSTLGKYVKTALGDVNHLTTGNKVSGGIRKFNALRSLSTAGISNASQLTNTATIAGIGRTAKGIAQLAVSPKARAEAKQSGVLLDNSIGELAKQGLGTGGKITSNIASPFFRSVEKFNRQATAIVGKDYGNKLAAKGDVAQLRDKFGVTGDIGKQLTRDQEIQVSRKLVELSQFKVSPMDLPGWVDSPMGKLVAQFRTFGYKQTDFMYNQVLREAVKGNFLPLSRFVATAVPLGAASLALKGTIKGAPLINSGDSNSSKITKSLSQVGGFGLPGSEGLNIYNSAKYKNTPGAIAGTVGGPTLSFATETADNVRTGQQTGSYKKLEKQGVRSIPTVGPSIANRAFPKAVTPTVADNTGSNGTPQQRIANAKAEVKALENSPNLGNGYTLQKLSNGKYAYTLDGDTTVHQASNLKEAQLAVGGAQFAGEGGSYKIVGDTVYRKGADGKVSATPKTKFDYQIGTATLTAQKNAGDVQGWLGTAHSQLDSIVKQLKDPNIDPLDALTLQNDASTLQNNIDKYSAYGGFTKPKSGKTSTAVSSFKTASTARLSAPKGISVRKPAAFKAPATRKLSVSKIPTTYKSKSIA